MYDGLSTFRSHFHSEMRKKRKVFHFFAGNVGLWKSGGKLIGGGDKSPPPKKVYDHNVWAFSEFFENKEPVPSL